MAIAHQPVLEARRAAIAQVQLEISACLPPPAWPGEASLDCMVARSFRGPLVEGDRLRLRVRAYHPGDTPVAGDDAYPWEKLSRARYLEACLDRDRDGWHARVAGCVGLIQRPTDAPSLALAAA